MVGDVLLDREDLVATVTLHNPDKRNALSGHMWRHLGVIFSELAVDETLRCIVLRGAGDTAFASGADISTFEKERHDVASARAFGQMAHETMQAISECPHPIVASIKGACVGGGLEIAALCDMRICGQSARFGIPAKQLGLTIGLTELPGLLAIAGPSVTLEILLEGRIFGADEALQKRLVNRVVPDNAVDNEVLETTRRISDGAPLVARWHKKFVKSLSTSPNVNPDAIDESYACFDTEDFQIGFRAFLAKTKPKFVGR
jgi:enoyl-CoA hydratase/carnithine racemase